MIPGAKCGENNSCTFTVWAPEAKTVEVRILRGPERLIAMKPLDGYWQTTIDECPSGVRYLYRLNGELDRPDPASHSQPEGVHGPSSVVDHSAFRWTDAGWEGVPLEDMILYELHVGTFTPEGTFEAIIPRLAELRELGINAVELMPLAQFPGERNWGYDGVFPYAAQHSYGGPDGLKTLIDAIHRHGMSAILDVVYNHLGPEGNFLWDFGPYFTDAYRTPWGQAINFDRAHSNDVRNYFIQNALFWLREYHFDALRLDALHAIYDKSAKHFVRELVDNVAEFSREVGHKHYLIGESDLNDVRLIKTRRSGGYGLDAQWSDDFHHSVHALLTGERKGYYEDFGEIEHLAKAYRESFVYSWRYSTHRKRFHGSSARQRPARQFVVCTQNHDQVGNRMLGERLEQLVDFESLKLSAGALMLSPYVPLLFMGQEYGEDAPFQYFVSHTDPQLVEAVRRGRASEFASFEWTHECPDPQSHETFQRSKLQWHSRDQDQHGILLRFYRRLIELRQSIPQMVSKKNMTVRVMPRTDVLTVHRKHTRGQVECLMNFSNLPAQFDLNAPGPHWLKVLDSADACWNGPGATLPEKVHERQQVLMPRRSVAVYHAEHSDPLEELAAATAYASATEGALDAHSGSDL